MGAALVIILSSLSAYLIGSIPTSYILAKVTKGVDIREYGSGNVGATNVLRVVGRVPAALVLLVDIAKGVLPVTLMADYAYGYVRGAIDPELFKIILGLLAIAGHIWTVFLKFKGGKGVATTLGVVASLAPALFWPSLLVWCIIFFLTNLVSLASVGFGLALPLFSILFNGSIYTTFFAVTICILITYKHQGNIKRLLRAEEPKTFLFKKKVNI